MIPVKLVLRNFISHLYSVLDFTQFNAALLIGSFEGDVRISNGVGKSALMSGIRFALYGKSKFSVKTKVIKRGKPFCEVEFQFMSDSELYKIVRILDAKSGIISVELSKNINGEWISHGLTGDTPTKTNEKIAEIIGINHDTFVNIVYFRQNDVSGFTSASVTKRKEILKEALQINIWDEYQKISKGTEKHLNDKLKSLDERIKLLGNIENELDQNDNEIKKGENKLNIAQTNVMELGKVLGECEDEIEHLENFIHKSESGTRKSLENDLKDIIDRLNQIKSRKAQLKDEVKNNNKIISNASNDCKNLNKRLLDYYKDILIVSHRSRDEIKKEFKKVSSEKIPDPVFCEESLKKNLLEKDKYMNQLKIFEHDLNQLTSLEPGKECPACLTVFENPKNVAKRRKTKQKYLENNIKEGKVLIERINAELLKEQKAVDKSEKSIVEVERTNLIIAKRDSIMSEANRCNQTIQNELKNLSDEWKKLKSNKARISVALENLEDVSKLTNNLEQLNKSKKGVIDNIDSFRNNIMKLSIELGNLKGYREELERRFSEKRALNSEKSVIISNLATYSKLSRAFGKDGIQAIIMENITEDLRQYANTVLKGIYYKPMSIDFVTQKQTAAGAWKEDFSILITIDNEIYDFEDISGGEQVRISIAIRLALSQLLMRRVGANIKFLLFDEVDQSLDRHGLESLAEVVNNLSKDFKVLVITHNEYMKENFEHVITVHMGPSGSILK